MPTSHPVHDTIRPTAMNMRMGTTVTDFPTPGDQQNLHNDD